MVNSHWIEFLQMSRRQKGSQWAEASPRGSLHDVWSRVSWMRILPLPLTKRVTLEKITWETMKVTTSYAGWNRKSIQNTTSHTVNAVLAITTLTDNPLADDFSHKIFQRLTKTNNKVTHLYLLKKNTFVLHLTKGLWQGREIILGACYIVNLHV